MVGLRSLAMVVAEIGSVVFLVWLTWTIIATVRYVRAGRFRRDRYTPDPWNVRLYWRYLSGTPAARQRRAEFVSLVAFCMVVLGVPSLIFTGALVAKSYGVEDQYWEVLGKLIDVIKAFKK